MAVMAERAVALLVVLSMVQQLTLAAVYKVGDSAGWTILGGVDYKQWAASKTFQEGDVIIFEYNSQFHNVMRVTHAMYKSCNVSRPLETHTTGNDTITIKSKGHHFFLCGVPGHCQAGQKVDINVLRVASAAAPTPSAFTSPSVPLAPTPPAPSPSHAAAAARSSTAAAFAFSVAAFVAALAA